MDHNNAGEPVEDENISKSLSEMERPIKRSRSNDDDEIPKCKPKKERLETRLISVLSCVVCFDLPRSVIFQCQNGHLMCTGCFNHLLADGRLKNEQASCPTCRIEITSKNSSRNLAVEKAVSELPSNCEYCRDEFPRNQLHNHERKHCELRPSTCKYKSIGCDWTGMFHQIELHEKECIYPSRSGTDILEAVNFQMAESMDKLQHLKSLLGLLSYENIAICDVQLCPILSDDYIPKLFYETNRFHAFDQMWVIKAKVIGNETSYNRALSYQLILKGKGTFETKYFLIKGPFGDAKIEPEVQRFEFRDDSKESEYHNLFLGGDGECNRLLAARTINVRLMIFLLKK